MKAIKFHKRTYNMKCLSMVLMIIGFFIIEGTTDSTFTTHRGFFCPYAIRFNIIRFEERGDR